MSRPEGPDTPIEILLVEDNPGDIRLIEDAFEQTDSETEIRTVTNGYDALYALKRWDAEGSRPLPHLALVDLNLPGKDGCEILEAVRDDPQLRRLPVIVLTSSTDAGDVERCYEAFANAYITKPTDPDEFASLIRELDRFWFERVQIPPGTH